MNNKEQQTIKAIQEAECTCDTEYALYNDLGSIKCQRCGIRVSKERR